MTFCPELSDGMHVDCANGISQKDKQAIDSRFANQSENRIIFYDSRAGIVIAKAKRQMERLLEMDYGDYTFRLPLPEKEGRLQRLCPNSPRIHGKPFMKDKRIIFGCVLGFL